MRLVLKFQKHYAQFQKNELTAFQNEALQNDSYLLNLFQTPAEEFIKTEKIQQIVCDYIAEVTYMCTFTSLANLNAFQLMQIAMYVNIPIHEFTLNLAKLTDPIRKNIILDTVISLDTKQHAIETKLGKKFTYSKLALALPLEEIQQLLPIRHDRIPATAYMFHITGQAKSQWSDADLELFQETESTIFISKQSNGTYLFYSKIATPTFSDYFTEYKILAQKYWNPAFFVGGHKLISMNQTADIYLAGDINIVGLEEAYISGVSAANTIIQELN
ncbi:MAG: protoporphyrinogen oxidase [uncultured bacterium]|nr:MAG: protoporphyrinogen oxidase [uncultured bacterium]